MRIVRYFFVGAISSAVDISIFAVAVKVYALNWFSVALCSFILATAVNYCLSIRYVFQSGVRFKKSEEISWVFAISGMGLLINLTVLWFLIESFSFDEVFSKLLATATVFFWNFSARSLFVFKPVR